MARKVIACAVTVAIHTPSMSPHLPVTAEEIAQAAIGAVACARIRPLAFLGRGIASFAAPQAASFEREVVS